jgi:hypothetical protein
VAVPDPADVCSGTSGTCDDVKRTDVCRPAAGVCDVEESCDGVANDCPADAKSTAVCRAVAGVCDAAESCDGNSDACPADGFQPDETPCNDGNSCSSHDRCVDGICGGFLESCAGDPRLSASYAIPVGGTCGVGPCWKPSSFGFRYTDKSRASDGIAGLNLKQGLDPGKTRIILQGKGSDLPLPVLPFIQGPNVVMQLRASNGVCWEARYDMPAFRNQPEQFRDK